MMCNQKTLFVTGYDQGSLIVMVTVFSIPTFRLCYREETKIKIMSKNDSIKWRKKNWY